MAARQIARAAICLAAMLFDIGESRAVEYPAEPSGNWMRTLQLYDQMLETVGYRLASSAGDLCPRPVRITGISVQDLSQYASDSRADAVATFGFEGTPLVLAVAPDSPAGRAGVHADDQIEAINAAPLLGAESDKRSYARAAAVSKQIDAAAQTGTVRLGIKRQGSAMSVSFQPELGCRSHFQTKQSGGIDAATDGDTVEVNIRAMEFAKTEDQVAVIVAHELAHTILSEDATVQGQNTSPVKGRNGEERADRLSVYLLARAGYPSDAPERFWKRYRTDHALSFLDVSHGSVTRRIATIRDETARMTAARAPKSREDPSATR